LFGMSSCQDVLLRGSVPARNFEFAEGAATELRPSRVDCAEAIQEPQPQDLLSDFVVEQVSVCCSSFFGSFVWSAMIGLRCV